MTNAEYLGLRGWFPNTTFWRWFGVATDYTEAEAMTIQRARDAQEDRDRWFAALLHRGPQQGGSSGKTTRSPFLESSRFADDLVTAFRGKYPSQ